MFDILNDDKFLEEKFNYNNEQSYEFNIKDLPSNNDIDFIPTNHLNSNILDGKIIKYINFDKINSFLLKHNVNLHKETLRGFFNIYLQHNNVSALSEQDMLNNFLKMVKFYNQFNSRKNPVYNNNKQNKIGKMEEKSSEINTDFNQHNSISKAMQYQNQNYLAKKKF